jgi:hypothetical protein
MRCWSPLTSTRCEPDRVVSVHPSLFSAASTRAALAMNSTATTEPRFRRVNSGFHAIQRCRGAPQCQDMTLSTELASIPSGQAGPFPDQLQRAVSAYLARFKGSSHEHTESDLRCYLNWRAERGLDPLAAQRLHLELYIRWMQETRRFKPSTISRRFSVTAGFYRTCAIGGVLEHSPAEHVRRPAVPAGSPTLASPTCSSRPCSPQPASHRIRVTSLWAMLGLLAEGTDPAPGHRQQQPEDR